MRNSKFNTFFYIAASTVLVFSSCFSQRIKAVEGKFQMKMESSQTFDFAKQKACDFARVQAMEDQFGRVVIQSNSTLLENVQSGQKVETKSVFNLMADTFVNAEWIEDSKPQTVSQEIKNNEIWLTCKVEGKAKEIQREKLDLLIETLDCTEKKCKTSEFKNGEEFYLNFKSPKDGFVVIFLDDKSTAYCIYPYQEMPYEEFNKFNFLAQKDYLFFSAAHKFKNNWNFIDQLQIETNSGYEKNRLFVLFSENPINVPLLNEKLKGNSGLSIPRSLSSEDFQKWIQKIRLKDEKMQLEIADITISK